MNIVKTLDADENVYYQPMHLTAGDGAIVNTNCRKVSQHAYMRVDALYHYFEVDTVGTGEESEDTGEADDDSLPTHAEVIVQLMNNHYLEGYASPVDVCTLKSEIGFTQFRDSATFIGGDITRGQVARIREWCKRSFNDTVYLDAQGYTDEHGIGEEKSAFEQLMDLAGRTKEVVDDGICKLWPSDSKSVMNFVNANPTDKILRVDHMYAENEQIETKWLMEGRFLANELIEIPGFQRNFNKLVIFGAMRYILAGEINLNKLYRLMAKLGRTNTSIFFVG